MQLVLDLSPQRGLAQCPLHTLVHVRGVETLEQLHAKGNVVVDGHGKRRGLLEHHAHLGADQRHVLPAGQQIFTIEQNLPRRALLGVELIHAVEGAQQRGLATARGADKGRNLVLRNIEVDVLQRVELAVVEVQVAH